MQKHLSQNAATRKLQNGFIVVAPFVVQAILIPDGVPGLF